MKFEEFLEKHKKSNLTYYYIDYVRLRDLIKKTPNFDDEAEQKFIFELNEEMRRVWDFVSVKQGEFTRRSTELERDAKAAFINKSGMNYAVQEDVRYRNSALKEEISELSEFINTNVLGFNKILKRHDRSTKYVIKPMYKTKLKRKVMELENNNDLLYRISKISLTSSNLENEGQKPINGQKFIRKTNKYWVHRENLMQLKCRILKNLPIYVFTPKSNSNTLVDIKNNSYSSSLITHNNFGSNILSEETGIKSPYHNWNHKNHDTCISSVYFDNENFDLYKGRLKKIQGAEAIRIRWYTKKMTDNVFIERKRHEEDWTGEESKKLRFKIPENKVNDFISGKNVWKDVESLLSNSEEREDIFVLYNEVQNSIINKKLRPVTRTFYKRTAFQQPNSAKVRISLDTSLCMIKENIEGFNEPITNWRREDVDCEYPFYNLSKKDIVRFPYAILEIKLESMDESNPKWIEELINSSLLEHVHKFSKFVHGTAILYPKIEDIPYWLPQMNSEIRKEYKNNYPKKFNDNGLMIEIPKNGNEADLSEGIQIIENQENDMTDSSRIMNIEIDEKRIAIPVRVEPKVFFANERTFLSWLHFSIFIGGIGTAMMGLGDTHAKYSGMVFIGTSAIFAIYALYLYFWRAGKIRIRDPGPYDDLYGPAVLVFVFLLAMMLSIYFKFPMH